jgi:hypothetical protein
MKPWSWSQFWALYFPWGWKMQMESRKPSNSPSLGQYSLLHHGHSTALMERSAFLFLSWPLDELGWPAWLESFNFFYSLVSRVTSSARVYLFVMVNITSDVLGFIMVSLRIRARFMSPFLKNMTTDLSPTSRMAFLLLQKRWMNSQRDSPNFWTTLARS